jgi:hypothetical protein
MEGEILRRVDLMTQEQSELADERQRLQALIVHQQQQQSSTVVNRLAPPPSVRGSGRVRAQSTSSNGSQDAAGVPEPAAVVNKRPLSMQAINNTPHGVFQAPRSPREFYDSRVLPGRLCDAFPLFTAYISSISFHAAPVAIVSVLLICGACLTIAAPLLAILMPEVTFVGLPAPSVNTTDNGNITSTPTNTATISAMDRSVGEFSLVYFGIQSLLLAALVIRQFAFQQDDTYNLLHLVDHSLRYHAGTADGTPISYITSGAADSSEAPHRGGDEGSPQAHQSFRFMYVVFWAPLALLGMVLIPLLIFVSYNNSDTTSTNFCEHPNAVPFYFTPLTILTFFVLAIGNLVGLQMVLVPMGLVAHVLFHRIATCVPQQHGAIFSSVHIRSAMARYQYVRVRLGTRATQLFGATAGALLTICVSSGLLFGLLAALWEPFVVGPSATPDAAGLNERSHPGVVLMGVIATIYAIFTLILLWGGILGGFKQATQVSISSLTLQCERWTRGDFVAETDMPFLPVAQNRQQATGQTGSASGMCLFSQAITMFTSYGDGALFAGMGVQLLPSCLQRLCCCCGLQSVVEPYHITFDNECQTAVSGGGGFNAQENSRKQRQKEAKKKRQSVRIEDDTSDNYNSDNTHRSAATSIRKKKGNKEGSPAVALRSDDEDDDSYSADETTGLVTARPKRKPSAVTTKVSNNNAKNKRYATHINGSFSGDSGGKFTVRDTVGDDEMEIHDAATRASTVQLPALCNIWWILLLTTVLVGISVGALYPTLQHFKQWKLLVEDPPTCQGFAPVWMWAGEVW